jgi:hypothetical protein
VGATAKRQPSDLTLITYMKPDCDACLDELERLRSFVGRVRFEPAGGDDIYDHVILITSANPLHMHRVREDYGLGCVILYDDERQFGAALRIEAFPFNLVVDANLVIQEIHANVLLPEDYRRLFDGGIVGQNPSLLGEWFCQPGHWNVETLPQRTGTGVSTYKTCHPEPVEG